MKIEITIGSGAIYGLALAELEAEGLNPEDYRVLFNTVHTSGGQLDDGGISFIRYTFEKKR